MYFLKGLLIGFCIAAPVGPIGIVCINRTLNYGLQIGLYSGLGAAIADATYGFVAGVSGKLISILFVGKIFYVKFIGGLFLCYLGYKIIKTKQQVLQLKSFSSIQSFKAILTTLVLKLSNPTTILAFISVFAGFELGLNIQTPYETICLVTGVFTGSLIWWCFLAYLINRLNKFLSYNTLQFINVFSGIVLLGFGLYMLLKNLVIKNV